ncbi:MAG: hypothetical protein Q9164_003814 [Protoblastenia rupestris]
MVAGIFTYEGCPSAVEENQPSRFPNSISHVSETKLFSPRSSVSEGDARLPSAIELTTRPLENNLGQPNSVESSSDGELSIANIVDDNSSSNEHGQDDTSIKDIANETSYSLIRSSAVREHFGDPAYPQVFAQTAEKMAKQAGSNPLQGHSLKNLTSQQRQSGVLVEETASSMPDPTNPAPSRAIHDRKPAGHDGRISGSQVVRDEMGFNSQSAFAGSNQTLAGQPETPTPGQGN